VDVAAKGNIKSVLS